MNWYYLKGQKTFGPLSFQNLVEDLHAEKFGFFDQVCKEYGSWQLVCECKELEPELQKVKLDQSKEWVVLKDEKEQIGPLSLADIIDYIKTGEIKYKDFIWKDGLTQWMPISQMTQLMNQSSVSILEQLENSVSLLDKGSQMPTEFIHQKPKAIFRKELIPDEAEGGDLVPQAWELVSYLLLLLIGLTFSLKSFPGLNLGTLDLGIKILSPVLGFLPLRAWRSLRSKVPKPTNLMSSPLETAFVMSSIAASITVSVSHFVKSIFLANFSMNSALFT